MGRGEERRDEGVKARGGREGGERSRRGREGGGWKKGEKKG